MQPQLARTLRVNATFSATTGVTMLLLARPVAERLGFEWPWVLFFIGVGLLLFAADLALLSRKDPIPRPRTILIIAADVGWVLGSALLLLGWPQLFNSLGRWVVLGVALVVTLFAVLQTGALKHETQKGAVYEHP